MNKVDWKRKLTSRKLWLAVAGFVSGLMVFLGKPESEATQVAALILQGASVVGYMIGEGLADSADTPTFLYSEGKSDERD